MANIVSLTEASSIALHGIILLAQENKPMNVIEIAEKTAIIAIPINSVSKVARIPAKIKINNGKASARNLFILNSAV